MDKSNSIKISVVIPVYNVEEYLEECLESVLNQTLREIEVICIDDGSVDSSLHILKRYALKYKNIIVLNQENCGAGIARNKGIKIANGEFVAFMDADDFYPEKDILECLYNNAKQNNVLVSGGSFSTLKNGCISTHYKGFRKNFNFTSSKRYRFAEYQFVYGFTRFIYNLGMLRNNNLYFPVYSRYEDPVFLLKVMIVADEFYGTEKIVYQYRTGIKRNNWTGERIKDAMMGFLDILNISNKMQMAQLHTSMVEDIEHYYFEPILKNLANGDKQIKDLLEQIVLSINNNLLREERRNKDDFYITKLIQDENFIENMKNKEENFIKQIQQFDEVVIYGAGYVGGIVADYIQTLKKIKIKCFAVSSGRENPDTIYGIPVKTINELVVDREKVLVLIATLDNIQQEIRNVLEELQFKNIVSIKFQEFQFYEMN